MIRVRAAWVLPIVAPPIRDGWVDVDGGRVVAVGPRRPPSSLGRGASGTNVTSPGIERDLGRVVLMPGLVNAHTHLELSYLRDRIPPAGEFIGWIRHILAARRGGSEMSAPEVARAVDRAIDEAVAAGTALVGDISNTMVTFEPLTRSALAAVVFNEVIRFRAEGAERTIAHVLDRLGALTPSEQVRPGLAAHAPYSVAPEVFRAMCRATGLNAAPWSVHLGEAREEVEFLRTGGGPWRALLEEIGTWDPSWEAPGVSPVAYLDRCGVLDARLLAVHGVQMSPADLACLADRGVTLVTCPRSNVHTGAGTPPVEAFYASGVRVAVGTDSLASVSDLNLFAELAVLRRLARGVPASTLLDSATRQGARALGFGSELGSIEPGRRARLLAVDVSPGVEDVEEYLVSGIMPDQVAWIDEHFTAES